MNIKINLKNKLHQIYKHKETKNHYLQYLFLEITKRCNLSCLHCGSDCKKETNAAELTTESWFKVIDYFKENYPHVGFVITGGEPLMHPDIVAVGNYINEHGMKWGMVTNGMLLKKEKLDQLIQAGVSSITLSLDGLEGSHNWLRNHPASFSKVIDALRLIAVSDIIHKDVVTCVSPNNLDELDKIAQLLVQYKIPKWRLFRIFPSGRASSNTQLELSFEQTRQMLKWIEKERPRLKQKGLNVNLSCEGWVPFEQDQKIRDNPFFCRSGINVASILSDGTITGCNNNDDSFYVGNIVKDNFRQLWENQFEIFRKKGWLKDTVCSSCEFIKDCNGGSVHLWQIGADRPRFCYAKNIGT